MKPGDIVFCDLGPGPYVVLADTPSRTGETMVRVIALTIRGEPFFTRARNLSPYGEPST